MATLRIEEELLELERRYWQAMQDGDVETAVKLTDFPCIITGASGIGAVDKATFTAMMKNPSYEILSVELDHNAKVRLIRDDVAIVAYKVHEELTVDGQPVALDARDSSTWVKRNGNWLCALHTEAIAGDAFGRDRSAS
jgi:hypothetical protein